MDDSSTTVAELKLGIRRFAAVRGWEPYHAPKNLVMALASEVGELCHLFRWLTADESAAATANPKTRVAIEDELADIANIVFLLGTHLGIDLSQAIAAKMVKNAIKYPAPETTAESSVG